MKKSNLTLPQLEPLQATEQKPTVYLTQYNPEKDVQR